MQTTLSPTEYAGELRHRLIFVIEEFKQADKAMIQKALGLAEELHSKRKRPATSSHPRPCAPYLVHPIRVALIVLEELELHDPIPISAALLHDVIEADRAKMNVAEIEKYFGRSLAMMVAILTKPEHDPNESEETSAMKRSMYRKRLGQANVVTKLVKLCDRLDTLREACEWITKDNARSYLEETRSFYLPVAEETDSYLFEELSNVCDELEQSLENS